MQISIIYLWTLLTRLPACLDTVCIYWVCVFPLSVYFHWSCQEGKWTGRWILPGLVYLWRIISVLAFAQLHPQISSAPPEKTITENTPKHSLSASLSKGKKNHKWDISIVYQILRLNGEQMKIFPKSPASQKNTPVISYLPPMKACFHHRIKT